MNKQGISLKNKAKKQILSMQLLSKGVVAIVAVGVLYAIGYFVFQQYSLRQEADGFTRLKQDIMALQSEFNKIDEGWKYTEGCVGKGGVYESYISSSCTISITNKVRPEVNGNISAYLSTISNGIFIEERQNQTPNKFYSFHNTKFAHSFCSLELTSDNLNDPNSKHYLSFGCSHSAKKFYFNRTDR